MRDTNNDDVDAWRRRLARTRNTRNHLGVAVGARADRSELHIEEGKPVPQAAKYLVVYSFTCSLVALSGIRRVAEQQAGR
jgi:hypothetical protein